MAITQNYNEDFVETYPGLTYIDCSFYKCTINRLEDCNFYNCIFSNCRFDSNIINCTFHGTLDECDFKNLSIHDTEFRIVFKCIFENCNIVSSSICTSYYNEYLDCSFYSNCHLNISDLHVHNCTVDIYDRGLNAYLLKDHPQIAIDMLYNPDMCYKDFIQKYGYSNIQSILKELKEKGIQVADDN